MAKDFCSNRNQCVRVDGDYSSWTDVTSGVPQGSALGPISFVYFDEMPDVVDSMCQLFANNANMSRNIDIRKEENTNKLDMVSTW